MSDFASTLMLLEEEAKAAPWGDQFPVVLDDRTFKEADQHKIFVRHSVVFGEGEAIGLGGGCVRYPGVQYLTIFFRPGEGNATVYQLADSISRHYKLKLLDGVVFYVCSTIKLPADAKGFSQLQVVCPFYFDSRS